MNTKNIIWIRILALFLALLFVVELILAGLARVNYSAADYKDGELENMAVYIEENDAYLSSGFLSRMREVAQTLKTPQSFEEFYLLASVHIADQDYKQASEDLEQCITMYTGDDSGLAELLLKQGCLKALDDRWEEAQRYFQRATELDGTADQQWMLLAESAFRNSDYEKCISALKKCEELTSLTPKQYTLLISAALDTADYDEALRASAAALKQEDCDKGTVYYLRARAYYALEDYEAARAEATAALEAGGTYYDNMYLKAATYEREKDYNAILSILMEMLDAGVDDDTLLEKALQCALETDNFEAEEKLIPQILATDITEERYTALLTTLAIARLTLAKYAEAEETIDGYLSEHEPTAQLLYLRGICRMNLEEYLDASEDFSAVIEQNTLVDESRYNRAVCYLHLERDYYAIADLNEVITRNRNTELVKQATELLNQIQ